MTYKYPFRPGNDSDWLRTIIGFVLRDWLHSQVSAAEFRKQFRQLHENLFSAGFRANPAVSSKTFTALSGVTKTLENSPRKPH